MSGLSAAASDVSFAPLKPLSAVNVSLPSSSPPSSSSCTSSSLSDLLLFSDRLWDRHSLAADKSRRSKHTAKLICAFYEEVIKAERTYAATLNKLCTDKITYKEIDSEGATLLAAWNALRHEMKETSRMHTEYSDHLQTQLIPAFQSIRKVLSAERDTHLVTVEAAIDSVKKASAITSKARARHEKLYSDSTSGKKQVSAAELEEAFNALTEAQGAEYHRLNQQHKAVANALRAYQWLEVSRISSMKQCLDSVAVAQRWMNHNVRCNEAAVKQSIEQINEISDTVEFLQHNQTTQKCPWSERTPPLPTKQQLAELTRKQLVQPATPAESLVSPATNILTPAASAAAEENNIIALEAIVSPAAHPQQKVIPTTQTRSPPAAQSPQSSNPFEDAKELMSPAESPFFSPSPPDNRTTPDQRNAFSPKLPQSLPAVRSTSVPVIPHEDVPPLSFMQPGLSSKLSNANHPMGHPAADGDAADDFLLTTQGKSLSSLTGADAASLSRCYTALMSWLLTEADWKITTYELLLLACDLLRSDKAAPTKSQFQFQPNNTPQQSAHQQLTTVVDYMRTQLGITTQQHTHILATLQPPAYLDEASTQPPASSSSSSSRADVFSSTQWMCFVNYRVIVCEYVSVSLFSSLALYQSWMQRQLSIVLFSLVWSVEEYYQQHEHKPGIDPIALAQRCIDYVNLVLQRLQAAKQSLAEMCSTSNSNSITNAHQHAGVRSCLISISQLINAFPLEQNDLVTEGQKDGHSTAVLFLHYPAYVLEPRYTNLMMAAIAPKSSTQPNSSSSSPPRSPSPASSSLISLHPNYLNMFSVLRRVKASLCVRDVGHAVSLLKVSWRIMEQQLAEFDSILDVACLRETKGAGSVVQLIRTTIHIFAKAQSQHDHSRSSGRQRTPASSSSSASVLQSASLLPADQQFLRSLSAVLLPSFNDFHYYDSLAVGTCMDLYVTLLRQLGDNDPQIRQPLIPAMQQSSLTYYRSYYPHYDKLSPDSPAEVKPMQEWSSQEWNDFADHLCECISVEAREYAPALAKIGLFTHPAEITLTALIQCFTSEVGVYLEGKHRVAAGVDETMLAVISALTIVRSHLLVYARLFSEQGRTTLIQAFPDLSLLCSTQLANWLMHQKTKLQTLRERISSNLRPIDSNTLFAASVLDMFNILATLTSTFFSYLQRMVPYGADQLSAFLSLLQQCVISYSHNIVTTCGEVHSIIPTGDDDYKLKQSFADDTEADKKTKVLNVLKSVSHSAAGHGNTPTTSMSKAAVEMSLESVLDVDNPNSLASQSLDRLCIRVSSIQACLDQLLELNTQVRGEWQNLIHKHPIIAPSSTNTNKEVKIIRTTTVQHPKPRQRGGNKEAVKNGEVDNLREEKQEEEDEEDVDGNNPFAADDSSTSAPVLNEHLYSSVGVSLGVWTSWGLPLPQRIAHLDAYVFPLARQALEADRVQAAQSLSIYVVYVQWRTQLLIDLYNPAARTGQRIVGGAIETLINECMPYIYSHVIHAAFPVIAAQLLTQLCAAITFVLVYGRRVIEAIDARPVHADSGLVQEAAGRPVLREDFAWLQRMFGSEMEAQTLTTIMHYYQQLLDHISKDTDELMSLYERSASGVVNAGVPPLVVARLIGLRRGKVVAAFMDKERAKQKKRQQQREHERQQQQQAAGIQQESSNSSPSAVSLASSANFHKAANKTGSSSSSLTTQSTSSSQSSSHSSLFSKLSAKKI